LEKEKEKEVIAFNKGYELSSFTSDDLKEILSKILANKGKFNKGTTFGGLHPDQIQDVIAFLMFQEGNHSVQFTVSLEDDDYHLMLTIDKKQKKP
tara:strand:+ start:52941 stop:53225 length:285 start_codon:yes stop_codon:yes gene_type:complete